MLTPRASLVICLVALLVRTGASLPVHPFRTTLQDTLRARWEPKADSLPTTSLPPEHWMEQPLDHFNPQVNRTWKQRYFVNDSFFVPGSSAPVFLCCGGEGPALRAQVVVTGAVHCAHMITLAKKHNALVFAVEHRYYGSSMPVSRLSTSELQWLSTPQALEDLAAFIAASRIQYNLTPDNRWVTFGGSYPGMVAGWMRLKYPHLVYAAVASSAPVRAVENYRGFNQVVSESLSAPVVGGSPECLQAVKDAFANLGELLQQVFTRRRLETKFNVCHLAKNPLDDVNNQNQFTQVAAEVMVLQTNDQACTKTACNISGVCGVMLDSSLGAPLDRLAALNNELRAGQCLDVDYQASISYIQQEDFDQSDQGDRARSWFYQTCTEYGFYQTCDPDSECPFTSSPHLNTLQSWLDQCFAAFGPLPQPVSKAVLDTNTRYGSDNPKGSRILFVNAQIDPWRAASVNVSPGPEEPVLFVKGASHHEWTHVVKPTDTQEVIQARIDITNQLEKWLSEGTEDSSRKSVSRKIGIL